MKRWMLTQRQDLPLDGKILMSKQRIREWYSHYHGKVYISFSGGKDSTVLLDLVRQEYPEVPAVFFDTGLEFPEIRDFVKKVPNVIWIRPKKTFKQVIDQYGYPVISKKVSMGIDRYNNTNSEEQKNLRLYGGVNPTSGKNQYPTIPKKWHYLVDAPFKCSEKCCYYLKKKPAYDYTKETGRYPFVATMATDSDNRRVMYLKHGCNAFSLKYPISTPMMFWREQDVWQYIRETNLPYCSIYDKGEDRTGCIFCMFGVHLEKDNRFLRLKRSHPTLYDYCMYNLGIKEVLSYIGIETE